VGAEVRARIAERFTSVRAAGRDAIVLPFLIGFVQN